MRSVILTFALVCSGFGQPGAPDAGFAHAVQLQQSGDLDGALREYQAILVNDPARVDARSNLGAVLSKMGRYRDAIEQYREALKSAPPAAEPFLRLNLALAFYKSFQLAEAKIELTRLRAEQPDNLNATLLMADCYLRTGEFSQVIDVLSPLESQQPENRAITYMLGMALIRNGQVAQGQQRVDKILRDGDTAEARFLLAMSMFMAKDYPAAVSGFRRAISLNPEIPSLQSFYGRALLATGDGDGAAAAFRKELTANPNDYDANLNLGEILAHRGQRDQAAAYLERASQLRPGTLTNPSGGDRGRGSSGGIAIGSPAPDFDLLHLQRYRGAKPVVLVFGSYTCPQFRGDAPALNALYRKYQGRVEFRLVYIKEAHASDRWQSSINERDGIIASPARDLGEKQAQASLCVRKLKIPFPAVTDSMDGKIEAAYDAWPSRVYLIAPDGRVAFNSRLGEINFRAADLDAAIAGRL